MLSRSFVTLLLMFLSISVYAGQGKCPDYKQAVAASQGIKIWHSFSLGAESWIIVSHEPLPPASSWKSVAFLSSGGMVCYTSDDIYGPAIQLAGSVKGHPCFVNGKQLPDNTVTKAGVNTGWTFYPPDSIMSCTE